MRLLVAGGQVHRKTENQNDPRFLSNSSRRQNLRGDSSKTLSVTFEVRREDIQQSNPKIVTPQTP